MPALFHDLLFSFRDSPAIEEMSGRTRIEDRRSKSCRQFIRRIVRGPTEVVRFPSAHSQVEGSTDIGTG